MNGRFKLAAAALALVLLAQPLAVVAECVTMPARECPAPAEQSMHCVPTAQLHAQGRACCQVQTAPAAPSKAPAATATPIAAAIPVKASARAAAPAPSPALSTYHGPPKLQDTSQAQALLGVFLI